MNTRNCKSLLAALLFWGSVDLANAQGTAFTYQGRLNDTNGPVTGNYDLLFLAYDSAEAGIQQGVTVSRLNLAISNGLFNTTLDFGAGIFEGPPRWLEIQVSPTGQANFRALSPRQALTATPYAMYASNAGTAATATSVPWSALSGLPGGFADGVDENTTYSAGNGLSLVGTVFSLNTAFTDACYWKLSGNSGTTAGVNFLGTTDNQALELKANNIRSLRLEPGINSPNIIAGFYGNTVAAGVEGATIAGGGALSFAAFPRTNRVDASYATIGGGLDNTAAAVGALIAGGRRNSVQAGANYAVIAGGYVHEVESNSSFAAIGGGAQNSVGTNAGASTISGGFGNLVQATAAYATIGGGYFNRIRTNAEGSTISGGLRNVASGSSVAIGGGGWNTATNDYAVVSGGEVNWIGGSPGVPGLFFWPGHHSVIGGGFSNRISRPYAFIGGGSSNLVSTPCSTVGGGLANRIVSPEAPVWDFIGSANTIGGGEDNLINDSDLNLQYSVGATIGGGKNNHAGGYGLTIAGGEDNQALGTWSSIAGGRSNRVTGSYAMIAGGLQNSASGAYALVAGRRAEAAHPGSFVWGDSTDADVSSTANDQFSIRANGGVRLTVNAGNAKAIGWGDRYRDNAVAAWARVNAAGGLDADFGVASVTRPRIGEYEITLAAAAESVFKIIPVAVAEVDAPPTSAAAARLLTINQTAANQFRVYVTDGNYTAVNNDFTVIVTGR